MAAGPSCPPAPLPGAPSSPRPFLKRAQTRAPRNTLARAPTHPPTHTHTHTHAHTRSPQLDPERPFVDSSPANGPFYTGAAADGTMSKSVADLLKVKRWGDAGSAKYGDGERGPCLLRSDRHTTAAPVDC